MLRYDSRPSAGGVVAHRIRHILVVYTFATFGVFLFTAPWSPVWDVATTVMVPSRVGDLVSSGHVRGLISGIGALNLWVAIEQGVRLVRAVRQRSGEGKRA